MIRNEKGILGKCSLFLLLGGVILAVAGCGGGGGGSSVASTSITSMNVAAPNQSSGGNVTVSATMTGATGVTSVIASITKPGGAVDNVPMTPAASQAYTVTYAVPANGTTSPEVYTVSIIAYNSSGKILAQSSPQTFTIPGVTPPPPPPL